MSPKSTLLFSSVVLAVSISCAKAPPRTASAREEKVLAVSPQANAAAAAPAPRLNLNAASAGELERVPGIGPSLAARIVEHRERYGGFRRVEHLMMVRGFSDRRLREVRPYLFAD